MILIEPRSEFNFAGYMNEVSMARHMKQKKLNAQILIKNGVNYWKRKSEVNYVSVIL
jgi:hypothetical protein